MHEGRNTSRDAPIRDVVAIDGPSGAGKSTVARELARRLGFAYLDTGAMYRAVTWHLLAFSVEDLEDEQTVPRLLRDLELEVTPAGGILVHGEDVSVHLRSHEVEVRVSQVSALPSVRKQMRHLQRLVALRGPVVAEGRDMASVVFPLARWKFYLDARPEERARRRHSDFLLAGRVVSKKEVLEEIEVRDRLDSTRRDGPLQRIADATYIDTTGSSFDQVVSRLVGLVRGQEESG